MYTQFRIATKPLGVQQLIQINIFCFVDRIHEKIQQERSASIGGQKKTALDSLLLDIDYRYVSTCIQTLGAF